MLAEYRKKGNGRNEQTSRRISITSKAVIRCIGIWHYSFSLGSEIGMCRLLLRYFITYLTMTGQAKALSLEIKYYCS